MPENTSRALQPSIETLIHTIRGQKVIFDADLAGVYAVPTKVLNQAVKRNLDRFPDDFMFRLTRVELEDVLVSRSRIVTLKQGHNVKYLPYVFSEHGAIMAANVLNSSSAVQMSVFVVRAFMRMRAVLAGGNKDLVKELALLEKKLTERLDVHEVAIVDILRRMMELLDPPLPEPPLPKPRIGF